MISLDAFVPAWFTIAAFGLTGSLHCAAMCGPLAAASCGKPLQYKSAWTYHLVRMGSYGVLGFCFGLLGELLLLDAAGLSLKHLALTLGFLMVAYSLVEVGRACLYARRNETFHPLAQETVAMLGRTRLSVFSTRLRKTIQRMPLSKPAAFGLLTAVLPCGFLYGALSQVALIADPWGSAVAMMVFALATAPALLAGTLLSVLGQNTFRRYSAVFATVLMLVASLAILHRGMTTMECHDHAGHEM